MISEMTVDIFIARYGRLINWGHVLVLIDSIFRDVWGSKYRKQRILDGVWIL